MRNNKHIKQNTHTRSIWKHVTIDKHSLLVQSWWKNKIVLFWWVG